MTAVVEPCPGLAREALAKLILLPFNLNFKMWHLTWIQHREQSYAQWRGCGKNIRPTDIGSPLNGSGFLPQITNFPLKVCMKITKNKQIRLWPLAPCIEWLTGRKCVAVVWSRFTIPCWIHVTIIFIERLIHGKSMRCLAVSAAAAAASDSEIAGRCVYLKLIYFTQNTTSSLLSTD